MTYFVIRFIWERCVLSNLKWWYWVTKLLTFYLTFALVSIVMHIYCCSSIWGSSKLQYIRTSGYANHCWWSERDGSKFHVLKDFCLEQKLCMWSSSIGWILFLFFLTWNIFWNNMWFSLYSSPNVLSFLNVHDYLKIKKQNARHLLNPILKTMFFLKNRRGLENARLPNFWPCDDAICKLNLSVKSKALWTIRISKYYCGVMK